MSCAFDKERLTAFFDGELDAAERAETERHVSGCSDCLRDLSEIKSAVAAVKSLPPLRAPRSIAAGVANAVTLEGRARRLDTWRRRVLWTVAAAAGALIILNVTFFTRPTPEAPVITVSPKKAFAPGVATRQAPAEEESRKQVELLDKDGRADSAGELKRDVAKAAPVEKAPSPEPLAKEAAPAPPAAPAPRPDAAPAPAPKPSAAAPPAPATESRRKLEEADKAPEALDRAEAKAGAREGGQQAAAPVFTVRGEKAALLRAQIEALYAKADPAGPAPKKEVASGGARTGGGFGAPRPQPLPLVVDLTPEQLEELKASLAKQGATLAAGAPEENALRGADAKLERERAAAAAKPQVQLEKAKDVAPGRVRVTLYFSDVPSKK